MASKIAAVIVFIAGVLLSLKIESKGLKVTVVLLSVIIAVIVLVAGKGMLTM